MKTIKEIEDCMAEVMLQPDYERVRVKYNELLDVMGNVDGDEVVALVLSATCLVGVGNG